MDTLSEILRDYVNDFKSNGMTGGALTDAALVAAIGSGNFRSVFDKYFDTTNPNTSLLSLELQASQKASFVNDQRDLITAMLAYHSSNPQTGTPVVGEPQLSAVTGSTRNPPHNKYWETLAVAAKLAQGGGPGAGNTVPGVPAPGPKVVLDKIQQKLSGNKTPFTPTEISNSFSGSVKDISQHWTTVIKTALDRDRICSSLNSMIFTDKALELKRDRLVSSLNGMVL
jgi:hypothetical protein